MLSASARLAMGELQSLDHVAVDEQAERHVAQQRGGRPPRRQGGRARNSASSACRSAADARQR